MFTYTVLMSFQLISPALKIPAPFLPFPSSLPLGGGKRGKGVGERGHFKHFHGFQMLVRGRA